MATRFSLKRLLLSVTLVSVGVGELVFVYYNPFIKEWVGKQNLFVFFPALLILFGTGTALIGAGIGTLFGRAALGARLGCLIIGGLVLIMLSLYIMHPAIG